MGIGSETQPVLARFLPVFSTFSLPIYYQEAAHAKAMQIAINDVVNVRMIRHDSCRFQTETENLTQLKLKL